jgi:hypothetical protein
MITAVSILIILAAVVFTVGIREKDLPPPVPENPFRHLDERKARIYEGLRDLQFEFRVGKLSDGDYQSAKQSLQKELAGVLSEVEEVKARLAQPESPAAPSSTPKKKGKPA